MDVRASNQEVNERTAASSLCHGEDSKWKSQVLEEMKRTYLIENQIAYSDGAWSRYKLDIDIRAVQETSPDS